MTTVIRRRRASRASIGPYKRHELLTGEIRYPAQGYTGYGDGIGTDLMAFVNDDMRRDWAANRTALLEFWKSGMSDAEAFPDDTLPWLCTYIAADSLPWACRHLD